MDERFSLYPLSTLNRFHNSETKVVKKNYVLSGREIIYVEGFIVKDLVAKLDLSSAK